MRAADNERELIDLREVVVEHRAQIYRFARSLCRSAADAEDLAQTALVRALQQGPLSCTPEQAKWYVLRIVRNLAIDQARARARVSVEPRAEMPEARSTDPLPEELILRADAAVAPRAAFESLDPTPRGPPAAIPRGSRLRQGRGATRRHRARGAPTRLPRDASAPCCVAFETDIIRRSLLGGIPASRSLAPGERLDSLRSIAAAC